MCAVVAWPAGTVTTTVAPSSKGYDESTSTEAPPPTRAGSCARAGASEATTNALEVAEARTADCANLGHPCGKLVMQQGKCETP